MKQIQSTPTSRWGAILRTATLCLCVALAGTSATGCSKSPASSEDAADQPVGAMAQVANPITEVDSVESLSQRLGKTFPTVPDKQVAACRIYAAGGQVFKAEADYEDGSSLAMGPGEGDISGIYGGQPLDIPDIIMPATPGAQYLIYQEQEYAIWCRDGYAYCYYAAPGEHVLDMITIVSRLMGTTPNLD